jgi:signal transduction histidine kinase
MKNSPLRRPARVRLPSGPTQRLIGVFVLFILLPGAFLGGFAFRALRQEGQLARQRTRESLERTAEEIGRYLDSEFRRWSDWVRSAAGEKISSTGSCPEIIRQAFAEPGGGVFLSISDKGPEVFPAGALLYVPTGLAPSRTPPDRSPAGLAEAEALEISRKDYERAVRAYRALLDSGGTGLRPLVLQRLARTLRKAGRIEEAAAVYRDLQRSDAAWIGNLPSDLIARSELCALAAERGDSAGLAAQALAFYGELAGGRWLLDKPRYLYYADRCRSWCRESGATADELGRLGAMEERKLALTRATEDLLNKPGRVIPGETEAHLAFWHNDPFKAVVLSTSFLGSRWWSQALSARGNDLEAALSAPEGIAIFGSPPAEAPPFALRRDIRIDETPWLLQVWPDRPEAIYADIRQRQTLSMAILAFVTILLAFGSYITVRIVRRELEIARLRADFVSTVSHEFRSPLTGIRQLGAMLLDRPTTDPEKQRSYFRMIVEESDRLGRLIENILDFSRMEEGRKEYRFEPLSPSPWLRKLVADFAAEIASNGAVVEADISDGLPPILADGEALGSAVRNLLDNAVKYSPGAKTVWLEAKAAGGGVRFSVRDRGVGISEHDREHIFDRFYRAGGEISKRVKGAGLGLSLVKHIVTAHGGTVECESRVGEGSTFTIRLKAAPPDGGRRRMK